MKSKTLFHWAVTTNFKIIFMRFTVLRHRSRYIYPLAVRFCSNGQSRMLCKNIILFNVGPFIKFCNAKNSSSPSLSSELKHNRSWQCFFHRLRCRLVLFWRCLFIVMSLSLTVAIMSISASLQNKLSNQSHKNRIKVVFLGNLPLLLLRYIHERLLCCFTMSHTIFHFPLKTYERNNCISGGCGKR